MTQLQVDIDRFAAIMGVDRTTVWKWLNGRLSPNRQAIAFMRHLAGGKK